LKRFTKYSAEIRSFGEAIAQVRLSKKMSVQELALEANIDRSTIQRIERGNAVITLHTLLSIAEALQVDPRDFFNFIDKGAKNQK